LKFWSNSGVHPFGSGLFIFIKRLSITVSIFDFVSFVASLFKLLIYSQINFGNLCESRIKSISKFSLNRVQIFKTFPDSVLSVFGTGYSISLLTSKSVILVPSSLPPSLPPSIPPSYLPSLPPFLLYLSPSLPSSFSSSSSFSLLFSSSSS